MITKLSKTNYGNGAIFSEDERYRYLLWRRLDLNQAGTLLFILLNPSTADHKVLDPTLRRCIGFAKKLGMSRLEVANLFALKSTDPKELLKAEDPVGPENNEILEQRIKLAKTVIVGWGAFPLAIERSKVLFKIANNKQLYCLATTKKGQPRHPLYLKSDSVPMVWDFGITSAQS